MHPIKVKFGEKIKKLIVDGTTKAIFDFVCYQNISNFDKKILNGIMDFYYYNFENEDHQMIFDDFEDLAVFIECFDLSISFSSKLIFAFIEDNIKNNVLTDANKILLIDKDALLDHIFSTISKKDLIKLLNSGDLNRLIAKEDINDLTDQERLINQEIVEFMKKNSDLSELERIRSNTKIVKEHYFDKLNMYTLDDLQLIKEALINLGVTDELSENITNYLQSQINKRKASVNFEKPFNITIHDNAKNISAKEYNLLNQSLKPYFDLESMTLTRPLSIKEVYYCLYLLKKLNQKEDIIQKFMKKAKQENSKQNIIAQYYFNIPKIEYYCQNSQDLESELKELKDYFKEYTTSLEEDKNAWEELLIEQLKELKLAMPNDGVYENEMVKKLVNKKEG